MDGFVGAGSPDPRHPRSGLAREWQTNVEAYSYDKYPESPLTRRDIGRRQHRPGRRCATCKSPPGASGELYRPVQWLSALKSPALGLVGRRPGAFAEPPCPRAPLSPKMIMPSLLWFALLAFTLATIAFSTETQASVKTFCPQFGRPCECSWHMRDCLPTCHARPRLECNST